MAENNIINYTSINFDNIKEDLKDFIQNTSDFNTYNFESSNITHIINLMSYILTILSFYLNQSVNENYIDSAQLRKNILSICKLLNYTPSRSNSSQVYIDITATPTVSGTDVVIPRYSAWSAGDYTFYNTEQIVLTSTNSYLEENVLLKEGTLNQLTFTGDGTSLQTFSITDTAVSDYMRVWTYQLDDDGNETTTEEEWDIYDVSLNLSNPVDYKLYFLEETETGYNVQTGTGSFGKIPENGRSFYVDYLTSSGEEANEIIESEFNFSGTGTNLDSLTFEFSTETGYSTTQSNGGTEKETIKSIRFNAPKNYQSQGRCVTANDYLAKILSNALVQKATVIGSENISGETLGQVFLYVKPVNDTEFTTTQLSTLRTFILQYSTIGIQPVLKNPKYIYLEITHTIRYEGDRPNTTTISDAIDDYINDTILEFGTYFKRSKYEDIVQDSDTLISSILTTINQYRYITSDDSTDTASPYDEFSFYICKNLGTFSTGTYSGDTFYIEELNQDTGTTVNQVIEESDLTSLTKNTTTGLITFTYATGFDFDNYTYRIRFATEDEDIFLAFNQLLYVNTTNDLTLTFEEIDET